MSERSEPELSVVIFAYMLAVFFASGAAAVGVVAAVALFAAALLFFTVGTVEWVRWVDHNHGSTKKESK